MANNRIQVKRTSTSGRTANTTAPANTQYIAAGEFALNMADGILYSSNGSVLIEIGANNTSGRVTGTLTVNSISANASLGTSGQVLTSNGTTVYWSTIGGTGTVTSVASGNGLTGGPITTTGTLAILANNGITANTTGLFVTQGTGTVVNATGVHVNATYIGTLSANNASFLGGTAAASYQLNSTLSANVATLTANNTSFVGSTSAANVVSNTQLQSNLANYQTTAGLSANVATLAANSATYLGAVGNFGNSLGIYTTGLVNAVSYVAGTFIANNTVIRSPATLAITGGGAAAEGAHIALGYGNNLATTIIGQANNTFNIDVVGGNTGATPLLRIFAQHNDATTTGILSAANTGRVHIGSVVEQTDSTFKVTGSANVTTDFRVGGISTLVGNVVLGTAGLSANGGFGTAGQVLHSNGTATYWDTDDQGVTSVATGSGLTGGTITTTGTVSVLANTGIVANATGLYVNATYIGTLSANNASFLGGVAAANYLRTDASKDVTEGIFLRFGSANQSDANDGKIGAGLFANGLNIVGTQTQTGQGREISYYGTIKDRASAGAIFVGQVTLAGLTANGSLGIAGQVLTSNGTSTYWSTVSSASANTTGGTGAIQYYNGSTFGSSANLLFDGTKLSVGNSTVNSIANLTAVTAHVEHGTRKSLGFNYTVSNTTNSLIVGPYQVNTGFVLTVESGARLVIV